MIWRGIQHEGLTGGPFSFGTTARVAARPSPFSVAIGTFQRKAVSQSPQATYVPSELGTSDRATGPA
jgi:hypothetical protein